MCWFQAAPAQCQQCGRELGGAPCERRAPPRAADPTISQGVQYFGFTRAVISLSHILTSPLAAELCQSRWFQGEMLMPNEVCSLFTVRSVRLSGCWRCVTLLQFGDLSFNPPPCVGSQLWRLQWETQSEIS